MADTVRFDLLNHEGTSVPSEDFATLAASYSCPGSSYYRQAALVPLMEKIATYLLRVQGTDGTLDLGNLGSPPDTAFILEPLCLGAGLLLGGALATFIAA